MQCAQVISIHVILDHRLGSGKDVLTSLHAQTWQDFQVVLLGTVDGIQDTRSIDDDRTIRLKNYRDLGFARMHNQAIALALSRWHQQDLRERFIVLSHQDVVWDDVALERLHHAFREDPALMIAGPTLLRARRVPQDDEGGYEVERTEEIESQGLSLTRSRRWRERYCGTQGVVHRMGEWESVFGVSEPCLMIRASALADLQLSGEYLDPDLPTGQEIFDLMWRAAWLGMSVGLVTHACVWHYAHYPAVARSWIRRWLLWYAAPALHQRCTEEWRDLLELKNDDAFLRLRHTPWIMRAKLMSFFRLLADPRCWRSPHDPDRWFRIRQKRRELQKRRRVTRAQMLRWFRV